MPCKLTERIVLARLNDYLPSSSLLNPHQSGFTKHHSTETLLVSLYNKLVSTVSHQQVSCLCLLDISAAFDTIDHSILIQLLSSWFGISGTAIYSGSNPIWPLDPSLLEPAATHLNPSHSPVVSLKAQSWAHSFSSCIPPH